MRITLKSPAAGHSAGDTAEVDDEYARWLIGQGYAVESTSNARDDHTNDHHVNEPTRARHRKRSTVKVTQSDSDSE